MPYIYDEPEWPNLRWDETRLLSLLADIRHRQGRLPIGVLAVKIEFKVMNTPRITLHSIGVSLVALCVLSCGKHEDVGKGTNNSNTEFIDWGFGLSATDEEFNDFISDVISYYSHYEAIFRGGVLFLAQPVFGVSKGPFYRRFESKIISSSAVIIGRTDAQALILNLGRQGWVIWLDQQESGSGKEVLELADYITFSGRRVVLSNGKEPEVEAVAGLTFR